MSWDGIAAGLRSFVVWSMDVTAVPIIVYFILINTSLLVLIVLAYLEFRAQQRRRSTAVVWQGAGLAPGCVPARAGLQRGGRHRHGGQVLPHAALPAARGRRRRRRKQRRDLRPPRAGLRPRPGAARAAARDPDPGEGPRHLRPARRPHPARRRPQGELRPLRGDQRGHQRRERAARRDDRRRLDPRARRPAARDPSLRRRPDAHGGHRRGHPPGQRQPRRSGRIVRVEMPQTWIPRIQSSSTSAPSCSAAPAGHASVVSSSSAGRSGSSGATSSSRSAVSTRTASARTSSCHAHPQEAARRGSRLPHRVRARAGLVDRGAGDGQGAAQPAASLAPRPLGDPVGLPLDALPPEVRPDRLARAALLLALRAHRAAARAVRHPHRAARPAPRRRQRPLRDPLPRARLRVCRAR